VGDLGKCFSVNVGLGVSQNLLRIPMPISLYDYLHCPNWIIT